MFLDGVDYDEIAAEGRDALDEYRGEGRIEDVGEAYVAAFREEADRAEKPAEAVEDDVFRRAVRIIDPIAFRNRLGTRTVVEGYASWVSDNQDTTLPTGETLGLPSLWISVDDQQHDSDTGEVRTGPLTVTVQYDGFDPHATIPADAPDLAGRLTAVLAAGVPAAVVADRAKWQAFLADGARVISLDVEITDDYTEVCVARGSAAPLPNNWSIRAAELDCDTLYRKPLAGASAEFRLAQARAVADALNAAAAR